MTSLTSDRCDGAGASPRHAALVDELRAMQCAFARHHRDGAVRRLFHVKTIAAARGQFTVADDLPENLRYGICEGAHRYEAVVRLSSGRSWEQPDWVPDVRGMALRLSGVAGEALSPHLPGVQDFLAINGNARFASDVDQMAGLARASASMSTAGLTMLRFLPLRLVAALGVDFAAFAARTLSDVAGQSFFGVAPIAFGPRPVKFFFRPRQRGGGWPDLRADGLRRRFARALARRDLAWEMYLQCYVDEMSTPVENLSVRWSLRRSPPVRVGRLTLPRGQDVAALRDAVEPLAFSPWHGIADHRPLGAIQELRRSAYHASATQRKLQDAG